MADLAVVEVLPGMEAVAVAIPAAEVDLELLRLLLAPLLLGLGAVLADMPIRVLLEALTPAKAEVLELRAALE